MRFWPFARRNKVKAKVEVPSPAPEWWEKKIKASDGEKCSNSDLAQSIITAVQRVPKDERIVLIVPEDNTDVLEALIRCGGEVHITLKIAPRALLQLLSQESVRSAVPENVVATEGAIPGIAGTFFTGGSNG